MYTCVYVCMCVCVCGVNAMANERQPKPWICTDTPRQTPTVFHTPQDFIPAEELAKLAAKSGDKAAAEALEKKNAIGEFVLCTLLLFEC